MREASWRRSYARASFGAIEVLVAAAAIAEQRGTDILAAMRASLDRFVFLVAIAGAGSLGCDNFIPPKHGTIRSVYVVAYEAPPPGSAFVIPFRANGPIRVVARDATAVLGELDHRTVTCENVRCDTDGVHMPEHGPPIDHLVIKVESPGFESTTFNVPIKPDSHPYPEFVVLMHRVGSR
jgi:hypothetical protein